ncbi:MAG: hypothetical protein N2036_12545 [Bryobacteraceae bacterium]|nr:hypothetical protein [Bryobacteraceae bacterium]MCX7604897.1 hypothetical protein [Bryobacteraceae bacterium]
MPEDWGLTRSELRQLRRLDEPRKVQSFLDGLPYNYDTDPHTCFSPRLVLRHGRAHCLEGALLAAAAFRLAGRPPLLVDLAAVRDDDHVLAVFREGGCWGAVAKSSYTGLRFRDPVYRSLRELVMSYFPHYYNPEGEKTLRAYSRPVNLARFDPLGWMSSEEDVWYIPEHLSRIPHIRLFTPAQLRRITPMDPLLYEAGLLARRWRVVAAPAGRRAARRSA